MELRSARSNHGTERYHALHVDGRGRALATCVALASHVVKPVNTRGSHASYEKHGSCRVRYWTMPAAHLGPPMHESCMRNVYPFPHQAVAVKRVKRSSGSTEAVKRA